MGAGKVPLVRMVRGLGCLDADVVFQGLMRRAIDAYFIFSAAAAFLRLFNCNRDHRQVRSTQFVCLSYGKAR